LFAHVLQYYYETNTHKLSANTTASNAAAPSKNAVASAGVRVGLGLGAGVGVSVSMDTDASLDVVAGIGPDNIAGMDVGMGVALQTTNCLLISSPVDVLDDDDEGRIEI